MVIVLIGFGRFLKFIRSGSEYLKFKVLQGNFNDDVFINRLSDYLSDMWFRYGRYLLFLLVRQRVRYSCMVIYRIIQIVVV